MTRPARASGSAAEMMESGVSDERCEAIVDSGTSGRLKKVLPLAEWGVVYHGSLKSSIGKPAEMTFTVAGGRSRPDWIER